MIPIKPYRIVIADDQALVRRGLRALLEGRSGMEICGEARTGAEAVAEAKRTKPDLVILELAMIGIDGLEVIRQIQPECPDTLFLLHTTHLSAGLARDALRIGVMGYVLKSDGEQDLLTAVDQLRRRHPHFTAALSVAMAQNFVGGNGGGSADFGAESPLTERELDVLQMLAEGKSNKQVAVAMSVSVRTVESHRNRIMHKMNFGSFSDLVRFAVRNSIVSP